MWMGEGGRELRREIFSKRVGGKKMTRSVQHGDRNRLLREAKGGGEVILPRDCPVGMPGLRIQVNGF